ncbi:unnamed protein product [Coccothraustes coccothraustes]
MATEMGGNCAICQDAQDDVASAQPCGHSFCQGCIVQWAQINPVCPLCRRAIETVRFSDNAGESLEIVTTAPEQLPAAMSSSSAGRAPGGQDENSPHGPVLAHPSSPQDTAARAVGGVLPEVWAQLFRRRRELLGPVQTWLRQRTKTMYGERWWLAESCIRYMLCVYGPDQELMIQSLQSVLEEHTVPLVQDTIDIIVRHCSSGAQRLLRSHAATDEDDSPAASSTSSSSSSQVGIPASSSSALPDQQLMEGASTHGPKVYDVEEEDGTSEAAFPGGPSHPPPVPGPMEWDWPQEEPRQEVVTVADPSAQGSSFSPSTPVLGWDQLPWAPLHPVKRRVPSPQDSSQPCKRPNHWQL